MDRPRLKHFKRLKKEIIPPLGILNFEQVFWTRDLLPEFLWIDALMQTFGRREAVRIFNSFLSVLDGFYPKGPHILTGTVGDFGNIPEEHRIVVNKKYKRQIEEAVEGPFWHVLSLYIRCPMRWLAPELTKTDKKTAIDLTRDAVLRLLPGKDEYAACCRAIPLNRYFAHNKILISSNLTDLIKSIEEYPNGDRLHAESFARNTLNSDMQRRAETDPQVFDWAKHFWSQNRELNGCKFDK
jgi:hypothetical protein